jgi:hypothetical protein
MTSNNKDAYGNIPYEILEAAQKIEIYAEKNSWGKNWKLLGIQARQHDDEKNMKYTNESRGSYSPPSSVLPPPKPQTKQPDTTESTQKYIPNWDNLKNSTDDYFEVGHWTADNWKIHINNMTVLGTAIMNSGGNPFKLMKDNENFMKTLASNHIEIKQASYLKLGEHPE